MKMCIMKGYAVDYKCARNQYDKIKVDALSNTYEHLKRLTHAQKYLKPGATFEQLDKNGEFNLTMNLLQSCGKNN